MDILKLKKTANEVRKGIIESTYNAKSGHPGGSLSCTDIVTYLYFEKMNIDEKNPKWEDRDRFVLSKGHCAPALYSVLAHRGFFPVEDLKTLRKPDSYLQGHPDMKNIPGVDMSSGSLGQGISAAVGMALSAKISKKDYKVYTMLGDGEISEGQVWEALMFANAKKLDSISYADILHHDLTVIDSTASAFGRDNNLPILLFGLDDPENIYKAISGEKIGTVVSL